MTAAWRRAAGWSWPSSEGPRSPGRDTGHLMRAGAAPRAGWPGSVAPGRPHRPDQPAGAGPERSRVTRPVANGRARPPAAANPGRQGAGPEHEVSCPTASGTAQTPPAGLWGPASPRPDGTLGLSRPRLAWSGQSPRPVCGQGRTCAHALAAPRLTSLSNRNGTRTRGESRV